MVGHVTLRISSAMLLMLILLNILIVSTKCERHKRYLVYPDGGPARAQFIIGLGVPVDLKEASVTVGTVIKFQYDLPTNSTEYTSRIYGFANTVSRDMHDGLEENEGEENEIESDASRDLIDHNIDSIRNNDTLVDLTFDDKRRKRAIYYAEGDIVNEIDMPDLNTELPLEEAIRRQELLDHQSTKQKKEEEQEEEDDDDDGPENKRMNRWDFYKIIEHMLERYGYLGKPCLLRTICEAAEVPFTYENGLLGEIAHILFTPSTTKDELSHHTDNEYHAAERLGRSADRDCESLFPECESSVLDTFTGIGIDTLHKFGLY